VPGRNRETTETRQRQIAEAALSFIGQRGVSRTTTAEIASTAGISEGNIYRHYKSKEAVLTAVIDRIGADLTALLAEATCIRNPIERLEALFKRHHIYLQSHKGITRTLFSEEIMVGRTELRKRMLGIIMAYRKGISDAFSEAQRMDLVDRVLDPEKLTAMFIGTINFSAIRWVLSDFATKVANDADKIWETFRHCLVASKPTSYSKNSTKKEGENANAE
jgi:TetR/AcrR family transcriptional regulator, fatty acid metabolism regulator protein